MKENFKKKMKEKRKQEIQKMSLFRAEDKFGRRQMLFFLTISGEEKITRSPNPTIPHVTCPSQQAVAKKVDSNEIESN